MAFSEKMQIAVDMETKKARLSLRLGDDVVVVVEGSLADFDSLIAQYQAAKQE